MKLDITDIAEYVDFSWNKSNTNKSCLDVPDFVSNISIKPVTKVLYASSIKKYTWYNGYHNQPIKFLKKVRLVEVMNEQDGYESAEDREVEVKTVMRL